jgi:hypothetical protein
MSLKPSNKIDSNNLLQNTPQLSNQPQGSDNQVTKLVQRTLNPKRLFDGQDAACNFQRSENQRIAKNPSQKRLFTAPEAGNQTPPRKVFRTLFEESKTPEKNAFSLPAVSGENTPSSPKKPTMEHRPAAIPMTPQKGIHKRLFEESKTPEKNEIQPSVLDKNSSPKRQRIENPTGLQTPQKKIVKRLFVDMGTSDKNGSPPPAASGSPKRRKMANATVPQTPQKTRPRKLHSTSQEKDNDFSFNSLTSRPGNRAALFSQSFIASSSPLIATATCALKQNELNVEGKKFRLTHLANGSYMSVYRVQGDTPLIPGKENKEIVIKVFNNDHLSKKASVLEEWIRNSTNQYERALAHEVPVAKILNRETILKQGFIAQEYIPGELGKMNDERLSEVAAFFQKSVMYNLDLDLHTKNLCGSPLTLFDFREEVEDDEIVGDSQIGNLVQALKQWDREVPGSALKIADSFKEFSPATYQKVIEALRSKTC